MRQFVSPLKIALLSSSKTGCLLRITYLKTESPHLVGLATPDAAGKARPTVNHLTVEMLDPRQRKFRYMFGYRFDLFAVVAQFGMQALQHRLRMTVEQELAEDAVHTAAQ